MNVNINTKNDNVIMLVDLDHSRFADSMQRVVVAKASRVCKSVKRY